MLPNWRETLKLQPLPKLFSELPTPDTRKQTPKILARSVMCDLLSTIRELVECIQSIRATSKGQDDSRVMRVLKFVNQQATTASELYHQDQFDTATVHARAGLVATFWAWQLIEQPSVDVSYGSYTEALCDGLTFFLLGWKSTNNEHAFRRYLEEAEEQFSALLATPGCPQVARLVALKGLSWTLDARGEYRTSEDRAKESVALRSAIAG